MRWIIVLGLILDAWLWIPMITDRINVADHVCPIEKKWIRYPEYLGGSHYAVCNPTGIDWARVMQK